MKRVFLTLLIAAVAIGTSPESIVRFDPAVDEELRDYIERRKAAEPDAFV